MMVKREEGRRRAGLDVGNLGKMGLIWVAVNYFSYGEAFAAVCRRLLNKSRQFSTRLV
jgi:hypothetical protein